MPKSAATAASLLSALAGLFLAAWALSPPARAQDTTYTNGQNSGGTLTTSTTITLTADTGVAATQSGAISGSGSISKAGNGTLTLSGASTYTGSTTLLAGTLTFSGGNNRLPGTTLFLKGGILALGTTTQTVASLGSSTSRATGTITGGTLLLGNGGSAYLQSGTYTNTFAGVGSFSRLFIGGDASATVTLNGTNDGVYSLSHNQVTIGDFATTGQAGIVKVGNANALAAATENVVVYSGTLDLNGQTAVRGNAIVLSGGSLINSDTSHAASFNQSVQLDSVSLIGGDGALTLGGVMSGEFFFKIGNGTLTLSGVNTYTGDTFVTAGTLALSGGNNLPATTTLYLEGGGLDLGTTTQTVANLGSAQDRAVGPITGGTLLLANGGSAYLENGTYATTFANAGASSRLLIGGDASATVTLNGTNNGISSDHNQVLIGNSTTGAAGIVKLGNANALAASTENVLIYSGTLDLNGQTAVRGNSLQLIGGSATSLINSDTSHAASFNQSVQVTGTPNLGGEGSLTLSGVLSGTGGLTKTGSGTLTLSGSNTYSGNTTVSGGTLALSADAQLGTAAAALILGNGTLSTTTGFTSGRAVGLTGAATVNVAAGQSTTLSGVISGSGTLTKLGTGTLTLSGDNTYTGNTTISGGTLAISTEAQLGNTAAAIFLGNGTLSTTAGLASARAITLTGSGAVAVADAQSTTLSGIISGAGSFTKSGNGTLTLSGVNTYTGDTLLTAGTLVLSGGNNLPAATTLLVNGGALDLGSISQTVANLGSTTSRATGTITGGTLLLANGGSAYLQSGTYSTTFANAGASSRLWIGGDSNATVTLSGTNDGIFSDHNQVIIGYPVTGAAGIVKLGNANALLAATENVQVFAGTLDLNGQTTVRGNSIQLVGGSAASLINSDTSHAAGFDQSVQLTGAPTLGGEGALTLSGVVSGSGGLTKTGGGTLTLSGSNTYSGATMISGGTLALSADAQLGTAAASLILGNGTLSTTTGLSSSRAVSLTGSAAVNVAAGQSTTLSGVLSGTGSLTKLGTGVLTLTGSNTYSGNTTISGGTLAISADNQLGNTGAAIILGNGTLSTTTGLVSSRAINIVGNGTVDVPGAQSTTLSGIISGFSLQALTKTGNGTLTLSGVNTYGGDTTLTAGTLVLSGGNNRLPVNTSLILTGGILDLGTTSQTVSRLGSPTSGATGTITGGTLLLADSAYLQSGTYATTFANAGASSRLWIGGDFFATVTLNGTNDGISSDHNQVLIGTTGIAGIVKVGNANALAASTENVQIYSGTLDLNGQTAVRGNSIQLLGGSGASLINSDPSHVASFNQSVQLTGAPSLGGEGSLTLGGIVSGGAFTKVGNSTLTLSGTNTYSGGTTITGGLVSFSTGANLGTGNITLDGGGLQWATGTTTDISSRLNAVGAGGATFDTNGNNVTFASRLDATSFTKTGAGTLTLPNLTNEGISATISAGTLLISDLRIAFRGNIVNNAALVFNTSVLGVFTGVISGTGSLTNFGNGSGANVILRGEQTYTGGTTVASGILTIGEGDTPSSIVGDVNVHAGARLVFLPAGDGTYSGVISGPGNLFVNSGDFRFNLTGANTFSGTTSIVQGTVALSGAGTLGSGPLTLTYDGTLDLGGTTQTVASVGASYSGPGPAIPAGVVGNITAGTIFSPGNIQLKSGTFANTWAGGGRLSIGGDSAATVVLSGANDGTYSDHTQVIIGGSATGAAGTVKLGNANALAAATENVELWSGTLDLNGQTGVRANSLVLKSGSASALVNNSAASAASYAGGVTFATGTAQLGGAGALTLSGVLSGAGGVTKTGNGTLTLSGANTYTGGTTISFGTVRTSHVSALGTGAVTVSGATSILNLAGTTIANTVTVQSGGSVQGTGGVGAFTIASGGNVSPGNSPGTLTAGATTFGSGGSYTWQINSASLGGAGATTGWDLLSISGALNITATSGSPFTITLASLTSGNLAGNVINFNSSVNSSYTVATASGGIGSFSANQFVIDATSFSNATNGGTWSLAAVGNNLNLNFTASAIPEPSTYAALVGACALGLAAYRKRRRC